MKKKIHSEAEIVRIMREIETAQASGKTIAQACKTHSITEQTYYRWKRKYGGMGLEELKRLKDLEKENARLKKLVADLSLDNDALKECLRVKI